MRLGRLLNRRLTPLLAALAALAVMAPAGIVAAHGDDAGDRDRDPAGKIASFDSDSGKLTIELTEGGTASGLVTERTWIDDGDRCDGERRHLGDWCGERRLSDDGDRDGERGWRHGRGDTSDLVEGAVVEDAILVLKDGRAFYAKIDLED